MQQGVQCGPQTNCFPHARTPLTAVAFQRCANPSALWCHILDKTNCRMCSNDCDRFCEGQSDCRCHTCPEAGATETWDCSVGDEMACYDQVLYCGQAGRPVSYGVASWRIGDWSSRNVSGSANKRTHCKFPCRRPFLYHALPWYYGTVL